METIEDAITARMLSTFTKAFNTHRKQLSSADPSSNVSDSSHFEDLGVLASGIIDSILEVAQQHNFEPAKFNWELDYEPGNTPRIIHVLQLHNWLVTADLVVGVPVEKAAALKKGKSSYIFP